MMSLEFKGRFKEEHRDKKGWREVGMSPEFTIRAYKQAHNLTDEDLSTIAVAVIAKTLGVKVIYTGGMEIKKEKTPKKKVGNKPNIDKLIEAKAWRQRRSLVRGEPAPYEGKIPDNEGAD